MIPGMNPRQMKQAMKKMGMQQEEVDATQVIIKTSESQIVISNPSVAKVKMMGQETWQITGEAAEESLETAPTISEEDINTVVEQTGVTEEKAREVVEKHEGDLAAAIMELQEN